MKTLRGLRRAVSFFLVFCCSSQLAGASGEAGAPGTSNGFDPYQSLPQEKSLLTSPQFVVIDDFNGGKLVNRRGATWQAKAPSGGALHLVLDKVDARNPVRGYSLKWDFSLVPGEGTSVKSLLSRLDISQASYLVFRHRMRLRGTAGFGGRFRVALTDWQHRTALRDITPLFPKANDDWGNVILPLTLFRDLDLDQLLSIEFTLLSKDEKVRGELWLDEIAFFGFNDVAFESNADNLAGFPRTIFESQRRMELLGRKSDKRLLLGVAGDTWKYFENARDRQTGLIVDHLRMGDAPLAADYTSPTNIAMDLLATVAALALGFVEEARARDRVEHLLSTLERMRKYQSLFYNFYDTKKLGVTRNFISSVDNGWLAIAFVVIRQAFGSEIGERAGRLLEAMDFDQFFDPENGQLVIGFDVPVRNFGGPHYGMLVSEARATSLLAIAKGDVPRDHWWFLYRTPPAHWEWQNQRPQGRMVLREGQRYFQGYYVHGDRRFVPSWGGSLFEFLMPALVINEEKLAPKSFGLNNRVATEMHRDYALKEKGYAFWGISPAAVADGRRWRYGEYGVKALAVKGYPDHGVIAPYASFLALDSLPKASVANIRRLLEEEIYGAYGFYDSVNTRTGRVNPQYLALDQGMILVAICNFLKKDFIKKLFSKDRIGKEIESVLTEEAFFND